MAEPQQQARLNSRVASPSTPLQPSTNVLLGHARSSHLPDGIYHIINVATGAYAALLSDMDRLEVVNVTFNLNDDTNRGSQWSIAHLGRDRYKIQNIDFSSFAGYDTGPRVEDSVWGKWGATTWIVRLAQSPNIYTVSPMENPDIFWMSLSEIHGTPLEFGQPSTARRCRWIFKSAGSPSAESQPDHLYADHMFDLNNLLKELPTVPSARYDADSRPRCIEGTRVDLLQDIRDWIADPASRPIFWLRGRAGTGKTTISLTVADECDRQRQLGASFIFSRDQADRSELRHVFPTIAHQLARLYEPYKTLLGEALSNDTTLAVLQPPHLLKRLIIEPLKLCKSFPSPVIVVIDALDECKDRNPISTLLDILSQHIGQLRQLKFFITSRPEPHIEAVFAGDLEHKTSSITLHDIKTTKVDADIALFIRAALSKGAKAYPDLIKERWPSEEDVLGLVKRSRQLFIFASTVARAVFDHEFGDPRGRLTEILGSSTSASMSGEALDELDDIYLSTLKTASSDPSRPEVTERLRMILGAILTVANPLSPAQLEGLLGLRQGRVRAALRLLNSVLVMPSDAAGDPIRLIHPSFFDFLTMRCRDDRFRIDMQSHHRHLTIRCFEVMRAGLRRNICRLSDSSKLNKEVEDLEERIQRLILPSLRYACQYWALHLCGSAGDEVLKPMERFSSEQMLYWIEVLSLLGLLRDGADRLLAAQSFVESQFPERSNIIHVFHDGRRFISTHYEVISSSALHIYISAFGLLTRSSILKNIYEGHIQGYLRVVAGDTRDLSTTKLGHGQDFRSPSFSPNGAYVSALTDTEIWIWHTATSSLCSTLKSDHRTVWTQFLPDNAHIVCGYANLTLAIRDIHHARLVDSISLQQDLNPLETVRYAADAQLSILGILLNHKTLRLWDTRTWQLQYEYLIPYKSQVSTSSQCTVMFKLAAVSSQSLHIAIVLNYWQGTVHIFQIHPNSIECQLLDVACPSCFAISPDGQQLVVANRRSEIVVWDTRTNQLLRSCTSKDDTWFRPFRAAAFGDTGAYVLFAAASILSWSLADGEWTSQDVSSDIWGISDINSSKNGRLALTTSSGVFLKEGNQKKTYDMNFISDLKGLFMPDGSRVVIKRLDMVRSLNTKTEKMDLVCFGVECTTSSPDSRYIVIGQVDHTIALYSLETKGKPLYLYKHRCRIVSVGFSHDGTMIISADWRGVVCIWDLRNRRLLYWFEMRDAHLEQPLGHLSSSPVQRLFDRFNSRSSRRLEMPSAPSLPSPIWRVGNAPGSRLWRNSADAWGFGYIPLDSKNSEALLYCKSRVTVVRTIASCGATCDQLHCGTGPLVFEITTSEPERGRGDNQTTASNLSTVPLHYHIADGWIMVCRGVEARRYAWLPPEWRSIIVPTSDVSNRSMLITTNNGTHVILGLTGLPQDF